MWGKAGGGGLLGEFFIKIPNVKKIGRVGRGGGGSVARVSEYF